MSTKKRVKQRDNNRCQICGDPNGKRYDSGVVVDTTVHHIIHKCMGGQTIPENLVTLCDLCNAVIHDQRWKEYFGSKGTPENLKEIQQNYEKYLKLPYNERETTKEKIWKELRVK